MTPLIFGKEGESMKRWIVLLAAAMLLALCGCQHISDAYTEKEEREMKSAARTLASAWLAEAEPSAVLGSEDAIYCDIVTDYSKFYLSGYVEVPYLSGEERHTVLVNPETETLYTDECSQELTSLAEAWLPELLGLFPGDVVDAGVEIGYNLPVTYAPTQNVGKFPYSDKSGYLPVGAAADLEKWLHSPQERETLDVSCEIEVADGTDFSGLNGAAVKRMEEENGFDLMWMQIYDSSLSVISTLNEDGGVTEQRFSVGEIGPFTAEYLCTLTEDLPLENGGFETVRTDFDLSQCVRIEREGDRQTYRIEAARDDFSCSLKAERRLPEMERRWVWNWSDGDVWELHWLEQEDGVFVLANEWDDEIRLWRGGSLTVS